MQKMDKKEELINYICNGKKELIETLVDEFLFLDDKLQKLKRLPFIKFNPENPYQQKITPAARQYKELLQQYTNVYKILSASVEGDGGRQDSPLRTYYRERTERWNAN